jgi:hypothetical protein
MATSITVLHCNKVLCASKSSKHKRAASLPFSFSVALLPHSARLLSEDPKGIREQTTGGAPSPAA